MPLPLEPLKQPLKVPSVDQFGLIITGVATLYLQWSLQLMFPSHAFPCHNYLSCCGDVSNSINLCYESQHMQLV